MCVVMTFVLIFPLSFYPFSIFNYSMLYLGPSPEPMAGPCYPQKSLDQKIFLSQQRILLVPLPGNGQFFKRKGFVRFYHISLHLG